MLSLLRTMRVAKGLTQSDLSLRTDGQLSQYRISRLECGRSKIRRGEARILSRALEVDERLLQLKKVTVGGLVLLSSHGDLDDFEVRCDQRAKLKRQEKKVQ